MSHRCARRFAPRPDIRSPPPAPKPWLPPSERGREECVDDEEHGGELSVSRWMCAKERREGVSCVPPAESRERRSTDLQPPPP